MKAFRHGHRHGHRGLILVLLPLGLQACVAPSPVEGGSAREPLRWILVERRYRDIARPESPGEGNGQGLGDGRINPDALVLAFQPLYPEDLTWNVVVNPDDHFVELVEVSPGGPVAPGEIVTATFRVGQARPQERYQLSALPSEQGVEILGPDSALVMGREAVRFRFTSSLPGSGGIRVAVERVVDRGQDSTVQSGRSR